MPSPAWRLADEVGTPADGATQMARDLALLGALGAGEPPTLRLYTWAPPALSLGRFQPDDDVDRGACERHGVDVVRRPTGGRALLHGGDLTYAVALHRPSGAAGSVDALFERLAGALIAGLRHLGVDARTARAIGPAGPACFSGQQGADIRVGSRKLCGSAQLRRDDAVLQHGSVLLRRLAFDESDLLVDAPDRDRLRATTVTLEELGAPSDPRSVADALVAGFTECFGIDIDPERALRPTLTASLERR